MRDVELSPRELRRRVDALLGSDLSDSELLAAFEALAGPGEFYRLSSVWGPALYRRNRTIFGPFVEGHLMVWQFDKKVARAWLPELEANGDVTLFRRVYSGLLNTHPWNKQEKIWEEEILAAFEGAADHGARRRVLAMYDVRWELPDEVAARMYRIDPAATVERVLERLDGLREFDEPPAYDELLAAMAERGDPSYFDVFRRTATERVWRGELDRLCKETGSDEALLEALELRHPTPRAVPEPAEGFLRLAGARGEAALPYLLRHVGEYREGRRGWRKLMEHAEARGWWTLWGRIARRYLAIDEYNEILQGWLEAEDRPEAEVVRRVMDLAGAVYFDWDGEHPQPLRARAAEALYRRFPEIAAGAFRGQFLPTRAAGYHQLCGYEATAQAALEAGDEAFFDFLASRVAMAGFPWSKGANFEALAFYADHYRTLKATPGQFARRAARVLGGVEETSSVMWGWLRRENELHKVLFADPEAFLAAPETIGDLLEATVPRVRALGLRALAADDPRARPLATEHLDLLLATPLESLNRAAHLAAFDVLVRVAGQAPSLAPMILGRLKEAADLRYPSFPRPRLLQAIATLLREHPELRLATEIPTIYGNTEASW